MTPTFGVWFKPVRMYGHAPSRWPAGAGRPGGSGATLCGGCGRKLGAGADRVRVSVLVRVTVGPGPGTALAVQPASSTTNAHTAAEHFIHRSVSGGAA